MAGSLGANQDKSFALPFVEGDGKFNLTFTKNILQKSPALFPLLAVEGGEGEGRKVTAGDVRQPRGKTICTPWS
jgi:hypothetical protein